MKSKKLKKKTSVSKEFRLVKTINGMSEFVLLKNNLRVLYMRIPQTGVVSTNITYLVGARDEARGETGLAHMLEHMLFKPTKYDLKRKIDGSAMHFDREVGALLNANTWKDRTTYFFSYPKEYFTRALLIEAERMCDVVLSEKEFLPERTNVLSEYDMYNGNPSFALSVAMVTTAFTSHPYGHETIGFREDIESYTTEKLEAFYRLHYRPDNAVLMIIGDVDKETALMETAKIFSQLQLHPEPLSKVSVHEPAQEGIRRTEVVRASNTQVLGIGVKHPGFPSVGWFETMLIFSILADGPDSILYKGLVDTGLATSVQQLQEPTSHMNLGVLEITLSPKSTHASVEAECLKIIRSITKAELIAKLKRAVTQVVASEVYNRDSSLKIAMELTEYVAAGNWEAFFTTESLLRSITVGDIQKRLSALFEENNMTIGVFKTKRV